MRYGVGVSQEKPEEEIPSKALLKTHCKKANIFLAVQTQSK